MSERRGLFAAFAVYCAVTVAIFWRLVLHITSAVPNDLGDPLLSTWILWWNAHHLPFTASWWDGLFFYPMHGALGLSDHRVGLGLIASPMQWLGGSPVLAYNITLLLTFPLSALAAHALAWRVTRSAPAAFVAGLVFGFNPYRMSHIQHLELLAAFWLPVAILAMHEYIDDGRRRWLAIFTAALVLQGLSSGYYLLYAAPLVAVWMLWFGRSRPRRVAALAAAGLLAALAIAPVLLQYRDIQTRLGLSRNPGEIEIFGADVTALLSGSRLMALWRSPPLPRPTDEADLYPGIVALALVAAGLLQRREGGPAAGKALRAARAVLAAAAVVFAAGAARAAIAPGAITVLGVTISITRPDKPLAVVVAALIVLGATSVRFRGALSRRSAFAFYAAATLMLWMFALGPVPKLLGHPVMAHGPYWYLMKLPGYGDRLRVPARFAMIAILTLSIAAAAAAAHAAASLERRRRFTLVAGLCVAIVVESWIVGLPLATPPAARPILVDAGRVGSVLELPLGGDLPDVAAYYQSIVHQRPVVNGYSGYDPRHYQVLRLALRRGDDSVFDVLAAHGPVLVRIDSSADDHGVAARLRERAGVVAVESVAGFSALLVPAASAAAQTAGVPLPIRAISSNEQPEFVRQLVDGDPTTRWGAPERGAEEITIELDGPHPVSGLALRLGEYAEMFPRALVVSTSLDGAGWTDVWRGRCGGAALRAFLDNGGDATMTLPLSGTARFVRLRQTEKDDDHGWSMSEVAVLGGAR